MKFLSPLKTLKENTWDKLDEIILKQYSRYVKHYESKGGGRYDLLKRVNIRGAFITCFIAGPINLFLMDNDFILNHMKLMGSYILNLKEATRSKNEIFYGGYNTDGVKKKLPLEIERYKQFSKLARMPLMGYSFYLIGSGINDVINGEYTENSLYKISTGISFLHNASSFYIQDSDPKLLDKVPLLKQAYHHIKEKLSANPIPVTVGNYSLEDKL